MTTLGSLNTQALDNPLLKLWLQHHDDPWGIRDTANGKGDWRIHSKDWRGWRDEGIQNYSFAVPSKEALESIACYAPIVEMGAGTGYWAYLLQQLHVDIIAYDKQIVVEGNDNQFKFRKSWTNIHRGSPSNLTVHPDRTLLLCWPDYASPFAEQCLRAYPGDTLIFIGENWGGCTADDGFFELLSKQWTSIKTLDIPQWDGIYDYLTIFQHNNHRQYTSREMNEHRSFI